MTVIKLLKKNFNDSIAAKKLLMNDELLLKDFSSVVNKVITSYRLGGRLYIAGNGGSAADAQHLAAEFVSKLARDRNPLPAEAITTDSSILTAIANDYGFDKVFSRQLACKLNKHDIFLGFTTSGNSENILKAIDTCKSMGVTSIAFTGYDGGLVRHMADFSIIAPGTRVSIIQEIHIILAHTLCESVEQTFFPH